jgi:hypothetical protein
MVLDLFLQHLHLGVEIFVVTTLVGDDFSNQQLGRVVLDVAFLKLLVLDRSFAGRIENLLLNLRMDAEFKADLVGKLLLAAIALCLFKLLEQFSTSR